GGKGTPAKLAVTVAADDAPSVEKKTLSPRGAVPSPDGKQMAFLSRGDVFVTSVEYPTTRQVTSTPQAERHISWGKDNRTLYYTSERSGRKNIYRATLGRKADPDFANATSIKEEALFGDGSEYSHPMVSPDGKKLAFVKDRRDIMVMDLPSGTPRRLTNGETYPGRDDGIVMTWSPDSRWLAMEMTPKMHDPYSDIALLNVETGGLTNITRSGYFDASPRFTQDGNALLFMTDRYGLRAHASWGSQTDLMIVFLNREARDRFDLSKEDLEFLKEEEKKAEKSGNDDGEKAGKKKGKKDKKDSKEEKADKEKPIVVELDGIETRIRRLTPYSADYVDAIGSADGETIYYVVSFGDDYMLYKLPVREQEPEKVLSLGQSPAALSASADGKTIFATSGGKMKKLDGSKLKDIATSGRHTIDLAREREAMFDYVAVEEGERFYTPDMHGIDWPAMTAAYRRFLPHINNNYDFAEMLSELLGELNVSHTGGRYRPGASANAD
ncbi:MAG: peptidase S41, partial [Muribaculaceae bacterium]|nr:peptidase S41 [Muribaculaceae bacterium]